MNTMLQPAKVPLLIINTAISLCVSLAMCVPAMAQSVSCQIFMDTYEQARLTDASLPALFDKPFQFSDLKPAKVGSVTLEGRLAELPIAVKNHIGYLDCAPDDQLTIIELCANLVPSKMDPYLNERFLRTSQALLSALAPAEKIDPLVAEAGENLRAALVRGDADPRGASSELALGEFFYARIYTNPEYPGMSPAQMCFIAEYFED